MVLDPARSFGQPIAAQSGVPTIVLFDAVKSEGSIKAAARVYEVSEMEVRAWDRAWGPGWGGTATGAG